MEKRCADIGHRTTREARVPWHLPVYGRGEHALDLRRCHEHILVGTADAVAPLAGVRRFVPLEVDADVRLAAVLTFCAYLWRDPWLDLGSNLLADGTQRLVRDILARDLPVVSYAKVEYAAAVLVEDRCDGLHGFTMLTRGPLELHLL